MENATSVDQLQGVESNGIDFEKYEGQKARISVVEIIKAVTDLDPETGKQVPGLKREVQLLRVATDPIVTVTKKDGKQVEFRASEIFNLKIAENGKPGFSKHKDSKIQKMLVKHGVSHPSELKGKMGMVVIRKKDDDKFFGIAY